jgi:hypothetical protein
MHPGVTLLLVGLIFVVGRRTHLPQSVLAFAPMPARVL